MPTQTPKPSPTPTYSPVATPSGNSSLRLIVGDLEITTPGTVLDGVRIEGRVKIRAANVTIRNSVIVGTANPTRYGGLVSNMEARANLRLENVRIQEQVTSPYNTAGIIGSNFTAVNVTVVGQIDSIQIHGPNVVIDHCNLSGTVHYASHPEQGGGPTHNDSIQIVKGDNIRITNTRATGAQNFALLAVAESGSVLNLTVTGNYLDGGLCTVKVGPYNGNPASGRVTGNTLGPNRVYAGCGINLLPGFNGDVSGNTYSNGAPVVNKIGG